MKIDIPPIYEEEIIEFAQRKGNVLIKYYDGGKVFEITFICAYAFEFVEFDHIEEVDWNFGLELQKKSAYIKKLIYNIPKEKLQKTFGGEYGKLQHYRLIINDVGMYNIICKGISMNYICT